ncbi:hypothetical protein DPX16_14967 [Anabarilius grahami]|uniref:Uncharacterized protein n=1 Tax=Anabarilius grahami TaxID=495550 RepID=A0A3N0YXQ8_ANAGA|nr:hypothetical protein DPX16_14967 [Anabarilius grahami]
MSLASLRSRIAFFSESDFTPRALPFVPSQEPVTKKQQGRGSQPSDESELTTAQVPCASLSTQREVSPVCFSRPDQRPSAIASDLVSFRGSDDELLDDSMSLAASDAKDWMGSAHDHAPLPSLEPIDTRASIDTELIRVLSKAVEELGLEWSALEEPTRSCLDEWFLLGRRQAPPQRAAPFFPKCSSSSASSRPKPASTQQPTTPRPEPMCTTVPYSDSVPEPIQPLATRTEAWQAIPECQNGC